MKRLLLMASLLALSCRDAVVVAQKPAPVRRAHVRGNPVLTVAPSQMRAAIADAYRPGVDRRFLNAVGELDRMLTGRPARIASATFANGAWNVAYDGRSIGALPEFPSYGEASLFLENFARTLPRPAPSGHVSSLTSLEQYIDAFDGPGVMHALASIDQQWRSTHDPALLALAARGLSYLALQQLDFFEVGDALGAKALAAATAAKVAGGVDVRATDALVAQTLDYTVDARRIASALNAGDPVRLFVDGDEPALARAAARADAQPLLRYEHLLKIATHGDIRDWSVALASYGDSKPLSLALAKTALWTGDFDAHDQLTRVLPVLAVAEMTAGEPTVGSLRTSGATLDGWARLLMSAAHGKVPVADVFESELAKHSPQGQPVFFDGTAYQAYYRAFFYSGLYGYAEHQLDWLSSAEGLQDVAAYLGDPRDPLAAQYGRWLHDLSEWKSGRGSLDAFIGDLASLDRIGEPAMERSLREIERHAAYSDPKDLEAARLFFQRVDTRPSHRFDAASLAKTMLLDGPLTERFYAAATDASADPATAVWFAAYRGDVAALRAVAADPKAAPLDRAEAETALHRSKGRQASSDAAYGASMKLLLAQQPRSYELVLLYLKELGRGGANAALAAAAKTWIKANGDAAVLEQAEVRRLWSEACLADRNVDAAFDAIAPAVESGKEDVVAQVARVLDARGDSARARSLAVANVERYPDGSFARIAAAEVMWREHDDAGAAAVLAAPEGRLSVWNWRQAGETFVRVFGDAPPERGESAFRRLVSMRVEPHTLAEFAQPAGKAGKYELAFRMLSQLQDRNGIGALDLLMQTHDVVKPWRGEAAALAWLKPRIPPQALNMSSVIIYPSHDLALLWTLIEHPENGDHPDAVWLARAAAVSRSADLRAVHGDEVRAYYADPAHRGDYVEMGRFLQGQTSEEALLKLATTPQRRCEIAYYAGVKAVTDGRLADASGWFRIACETGQSTNAEYRWSKDQLLHWADQERSLSRLDG